MEGRCLPPTHRFFMPSPRAGHYSVVVGDGLLGPRSPEIASALGGQRALLVTTPTVASHYAASFDALAREQQISYDTLVLACDEAHKTLARVETICARALDMQIERRGVLIALGGGICSDLVGVAASMIRRGIVHVRIPTTLIAQIDAGIGIKAAVNFGAKKSFLGSFYPPGAVIVDPAFLATTSPRMLRHGLSEILKIAIVRDATLFDLVAEHHAQLVRTRFRHPVEPARQIIALAIQDMLEELAPNLYEDQTYERRVDFGHTFSPLFEAMSAFTIPHGDAVSLDMALTVNIATELGYLSDVHRLAILDTMAAVGLPVHHSVMTADVCVAAMMATLTHRDGRLNLVLPTSVGQSTFWPDVIPTRVLEAALARLPRGGRGRRMLPRRPAEAGDVDTGEVVPAPRAAAAR
jgi:3-dehydroquinate synthetase